MQFSKVVDERCILSVGGRRAVSQRCSNWQRPTSTPPRRLAVSRRLCRLAARVYAAIGNGMESRVRCLHHGLLRIWRERGSATQLRVFQFCIIVYKNIKQTCDENEIIVEGRSFGSGAPVSRLPVARSATSRPLRPKTHARQFVRALAARRFHSAREHKPDIRLVSKFPMPPRPRQYDPRRRIQRSCPAPPRRLAANRRGRSKARTGLDRATSCVDPDPAAASCRAFHIPPRLCSWIKSSPRWLSASAKVMPSTFFIAMQGAPSNSLSVEPASRPTA